MHPFFYKYFYVNLYALVLNLLKDFFERSKLSFDRLRTSAGIYMHRNKLITLLNQYNPIFPEEKRAQQRMLEFIMQYSDCFERSLEIGHITASSWLLNKDHTHALLMHHAKLDKWVQLGGHCDGNADVLEVAIKEAQEESGIMSIEPLSHGIFDIDVHLIPARKHEPEHYHYDVRFLLQITSDEDFIQNNESKELRWINKNRDELPANEQSVIRLFDKWLTL